MKTISKFLSFLLFAFLTNSLIGQNEGIRLGLTPLPKGDPAVYAVSLPSGETVQFRNAISTSDSLGYLLGRYAPDGTPLLIQKQGLTDGNTSMTPMVNDMILTSSGEVAVLGISRFLTLNNSDPFLAFFDPQTLSLNKLIRIKGWNSQCIVHQVIEASNGDYYITGMTATGFQPLAGFAVTRLNRQSGVVFSNVYDLPVPQANTPTGIVEISSNNFMIFGDSRSSNVSTDNRHIAFSIDAGGSVNWARHYTSNGYIRVSNGLLKTGSNRVNVYANCPKNYSNPSNLAHNNAVLLQLDTLGNLLQANSVPNVSLGRIAQRDSLLSGCISILDNSPTSISTQGLLSLETNGTLMPTTIFELANVLEATAPPQWADLVNSGPDRLTLIGNMRVDGTGTASDSIYPPYQMNMNEFDLLPCLARDTILTIVPYTITDTAFSLNAVAVALTTDSLQTYTLAYPYQDSIICQSNCVWPGDANRDGTADNNDLLQIGLAFNATGSPRSSISNAWACQPSPDWVQVFQGGLPYQHADCNGDGTINADDTLAIHLNYGLTHSKTGGLSASQADPLLYLNWGQDSARVGDTAWADIMLGTQALPVDSIYGIALSISYDNALVDSSSAYIVFDSSWLGTTANTLTMQRDFWSKGYIDGAIIRTDGNNVAGYGHIARLHIVLIDNIEGKRQGVSPLPLEVQRYQAVTAHEAQVALQTQGDILKVTGVTTSRPAAEQLQPKVTIFPNPSRGHLTIQSEDIYLDQVQICDLQGRALSSLRPHGKQSQLDLSELPAGMYMIRIHAGGRSSNHKLILRY